MREIKFRGKRVDNGEWAYGWYVKVQGKHYIVMDLATLLPLTAYGAYAKDGSGWKEHFGTYGIAGFVEVIPETVGQSTDFKDCKRTKIFRRIK